MDLIVQLSDERSMAVMLVSHDIGLVSAYADRIQVMYAGELVESGPAPLVIGQPRHPYTQGLVASQPGCGARTRKTLLPAIGGQVPGIDINIAGCLFAGRCPVVEDQCTATQNLRHPVEQADVLVRCHR